MNAPLAPLAARYLFNHRMLAVVVADFKPEDWRFAPERGGNSPHWLLGHVVASRRGFLRAIGEPLEKEAWEKSFDRGAKPGDTTGWPEPEALKKEFESLGVRLARSLRGMDAAEAAKPFPVAMPDGSKDREGALHFGYFHETYHLGQLGYLRRLRGLPGFI